jgi:glycosyltransferase involved in cell wall biosynthesis
VSATEQRTILFVHPSDELYGADRVLLEIVRGLPERYRAIVVLPLDIAYEGELSDALRELEADVRRIDMAVLRRAHLHPLRLPRLVWRWVVGTNTIAKLARSERVDLIHSNTVAVTCGAAAARLIGCPHLWDIHEHLADEPRMLRALLRAAISLAPGRVLANSRSSARSIAGNSRRRRRKTSVVYYGVDDVRLRPVPGSQSTGALRIGFLGRLTPRKGIEQAINAIAIVQGRGRQLEFHVYGDAPPGQEWRDAVYRERARMLGIEDTTSFHGFVPDARDRLADIDVLLVPSQRPEPFGIVLVEGMLARCVVIASRNGGGSDEILTDGVTGLYSDCSARSIAAAIERVAADPILREQIGAAARANALTRFSVARFNEDMLAIYDSIARH